MFLSKLFKKAPSLEEQEMFVIFGTMRSGSNLLQEKLNYFGDLVCLGELYNPKYVGVSRPHIKRMKYAGWSKKDPEARARRDEDPVKLLNDVLLKARKDEKILGFRHFDGHNADIRSLMIERENVHKVLLSRNLVDSFVSLTFAKESGQWIKRGDKEQKVTQVRFEVDEYEKYVAKTRAYFQAIKDKLDALNQPHKIISYEDVLDDDRVAEVARFVGSKGKSMNREPTLQKQRGGTLQDKLSNYHEVEGYLKTCETEALV